jgi:hypothetical protein
MYHSRSVPIDHSNTLESIPTVKENIFNRVSHINATGKIFLKDPSKPDGDACHDDGTLKDASELEWPDSPSDIKASNNTFDDYAMDYDRLNEEVSHGL